ncbi:hypothetical protein D3C81_2024770 [compost metagenome]
MDTCASRAGLAARYQGSELARERFRGGFVGQVQGQGAKRGGHGAERVVKNGGEITDSRNYRNAGFC